MTDVPPLDPEKVLTQALTDLARDAERAAGAVPSAGELAAAFPAYRFDGALGRGGSGVVLRAFDREHEREVAVKLLRPALADDPAFRERFEREARTLAQLEHPNIVRVLDGGVRGGWCYVVTELVDGADLRAMLQPGRLSVDETLRLVRQICAALQCAHEHGVVHRDVKPENILIDADGNVKVADFGLAKLVGAEHDALGLTLTRQVVGTPHYMAPEQIEAPASVDHRADLFALGVVMYEMLTGRLPLGRFEPPSAHAGRPPALDAVVLRCLEREPKRRYRSAAALRHDLAPQRLRQRTRRLRLAPTHDAVATLAVVSLCLGLLSVLPSLGWPLARFIPLILLAAASSFGFRALALTARSDRRGVGFFAIVVAAWLPVLLLANLVFLALLQVLGPIVSDALIGKRLRFEDVGLEVWIAMLALDAILLDRHAARLRRRA